MKLICLALCEEKNGKYDFSHTLLGTDGLAAINSNNVYINVLNIPSNKGTG
jgi:hypothetical protein